MEQVKAKYIIYSIGFLAVVINLFGLSTNRLDLTYDSTLIGAGLVGVLYPKIIINFLKEEALAKGEKFDTIFSETTFSVLGIMGGLTLIVVGITDRIYNWLW